MASRATLAPTRFPAALPPEVWAEIFRKLDIESLLNVADATGPAWRRLIFSATLLRSVTFDRKTDERILRKFLLATREEFVEDKPVGNVPFTLQVRELRFATFFTLSSEVILDCVGRCQNLRGLHCVNCCVEPTRLFSLLSLRLRRVTR
ncbi:hypothetical protein MRX96_014523 [Rhipicephalus microplus]